MKSVRHLLALSLVVVLTACGGGGYEGTPNPNDTSTLPLSVVMPASGAVVLVPGEKVQLTIQGGTRPYQATSSNTAVALASVSDNQLSVSGLVGSTVPVTITLSDAKGNKAVTTVTVTNSPDQGSFTLTSNNVTLQPGASTKVTINGGTAPFSVISRKPAVAEASVSGSTITLQGLSEGAEAEVRVSDAQGVIRSLWVNVAAGTASPSGLALFSNVPSQWVLRPGRALTYTVGGGTPPYSVDVSNPAVVNARFRSAALTLNTLSTGRSTVTITDNAGNTLAYNLTVTGTFAPLTLTNTTLSGPVGTTLTVGIAGGRPPYKALNDNAAGIAVASIVNEDTLSIALENEGGPMRLTVQDADGQTASLTVTAAPLLSKISVSPTEVVLSELLSEDTDGTLLETAVTIRILRGKAPYQVISSHPNLLRGTINGETIRVAPPGSTSSAPVPACVDATTPVTITVIDSTGASATTTVTITDNGDCPV